MGQIPKFNPENEDLIPHFAYNNCHICQPLSDLVSLLTIVSRKVMASNTPERYYDR